MAKYNLTFKAIEDLSDIWNYSSETWSEKQADKYYTMLLDFCNELAQKPDANKHSVENNLEARFTNNWNDKACKDNELKNIIAGLIDEVKKAAREQADTYKSDAVKSRAAQEVVEAINSIPYNATVKEIENIAEKAIQTVAPITKAILKLDNITLEAAYPGSWGNDLQAQIDHNTGNGSDSNLFNLSVRLGEGGEFETFRNVSVTLIIRATFRRYWKVHLS